MIVALDPERLIAVAVELVGRKDLMTISRFIDFVSEEQTRAAIEAIDDEGALLRIAYYMGSKNRVDHLFRVLSAERIRRMAARVEQDRDELLPAFMSVLTMSAMSSSASSRRSSPSSPRKYSRATSGRLRTGSCGRTCCPSSRRSQRPHSGPR
jgi:hypothetical protein